MTFESASSYTKAFSSVTPALAVYPLYTEHLARVSLFRCASLMAVNNETHSIYKRAARHESESRRRKVSNFTLHTFHWHRMSFPWYQPHVFISLSRIFEKKTVFIAVLFRNVKKIRRDFRFIKPQYLAFRSTLHCYRYL